MKKQEFTSPASAGRFDPDTGASRYRPPLALIAAEISKPKGSNNVTIVSEVFYLELSEGQRLTCQHMLFSVSHIAISHLAQRQYLVQLSDRIRKL